MKKLFAFTVACLILVMGSTHELRANSVTVGDLVISNVWARSTPTNVKTAAVYLTITNNGQHMDRVSGARTTMAGKAMIHQSKMVDGVMKMEHAQHAMIKAGGKLEMAPGGMHVMLMKLTGQLREGMVFPLILMFENSGDVELQVTVKKTGS